MQQPCLLQHIMASNACRTVVVQRHWIYCPKYSYKPEKYLLPFCSIRKCPEPEYRSLISSLTREYPEHHIQIRSQGYPCPTDIILIFWFCRGVTAAPLSILQSSPRCYRILFIVFTYLIYSLTSDTRTHRVKKFLIATLIQMIHFSTLTTLVQEVNTPIRASSPPPPPGANSILHSLGMLFDLCNLFAAVALNMRILIISLKKKHSSPRINSHRWSAVITLLQHLKKQNIDPPLPHPPLSRFAAYVTISKLEPIRPNSNTASTKTWSSLLPFMIQHNTISTQNKYH